MTKFRNTFLGLIDRAAESSKQIVDSLDKAVSDIDLDEIHKDFGSRFNSILSSGRGFRFVDKTNTLSIFPIFVINDTFRE